MPVAFSSENPYFLCSTVTSFQGFSRRGLLESLFRERHESSDVDVEGGSRVAALLIDPMRKLVTLARPGGVRTRPSMVSSFRQDFPKASYSCRLIPFSFIFLEAI